MHYPWGYWPMKYAIKFIYAAGAAALLASCGGGVKKGGDYGELPPAPSAPGGVSDFPVKIGAPYKIGNASYTPEDVAAYDDVGYASFYGQELEGRPTANGEVFRAAGISAAHKTLPLPTYAEITALDTGKTILVRINDRGPFANDRLIDLSLGAAQQLGITGQGVAGVRVRKVNPPEQERAALRSGRSVPNRIETPDSLLRVLRKKLSSMPKPAAYSPAAKPVYTAGNNAGAIPRASANGRFVREGTQQPSGNPPVRRPAMAGTKDGRFIKEGSSNGSVKSSGPAATGGYVVQLASFTSRARAVTLAKKLGASVQSSADGNIHRVRYGPYSSEADAQRGLATARQRGYPQARIFRR